MISRPKYDDDYFSETRMSFGEHIEDLRTHLLRAIYALVLGTIGGFFISKYVFDYIKAPVTDAMKRFYEDRRVEVFREMSINPNHPLNTPILIQAELSGPSLAKAISGIMPEVKLNPPEDSKVTLEMQVRKPVQLAADLQTRLDYLGRRIDLNAMGATETFVVYFMISLVVGLIVASPFIFWQIWAFVAAGLYPHEKKFVYSLLPMSIGFFLLGVLICQVVVMPAALDALLSFNKWLNVEPDFRLREWLSFAIWMPVVTGICFQTPLVMMFLGKLGIVGSKGFLKHWRVCLFVMLVFAAVVSPSVDPMSLLWIWGPMALLYFVGIYMVIRIEKKRKDFAEEMTEEVPYEPELSEKS